MGFNPGSGHEKLLVPDCYLAGGLVQVPDVLNKELNTIPISSSKIKDLFQRKKKDTLLRVGAAQ